MKTPKELALLAARALSDKKGKEIQALEIADLTTLADYFVLATGSSNTQINALVDNVEKVLHEEAGEEPLHRRLTDNAGNTDYICSDGIVLDGTSPVITGIENGKRR